MDINYLSENVREYLNAWELRTLILLSLLLQILLVIFANRRKYMAGRGLGVFVWFAYLSADWVAIFSLGVLARSQGTVLASSQGDEGKNSINPKFIPLFWAPALLVHLGGPDSITAYAMQDNDFGIRRLLEAITQVVVVIYVLIKLWSKDNVPLVAIPIFFVGLYKYGERIWVLRLASSKKFRASSINEHLRLIDIKSEANFFYEAHKLFQMFKGLLSNLLLSRSNVSSSRRLISLHGSEIFKLIEIELGFAYDALYTKITGVHSGRIVLRSVGFLLTISALVVFSTSINKLHFSRIDIFISYILLVGAIILEIYSIMVFLFSDWTMLWFANQNTACANCFYRAIWSSRLQSFFNNDNKRWSGLMAQHDLLIATQLREDNWDKFLDALVDKGAKIQGWKEVSVDIKQLIFNRLLQRSRTSTIKSLDSLRIVLEERGSEVLRRKNCFGDFGWSVVDLEFGQSLLVWHIATSICYWEEFHKNREPGSDPDPRRTMSQSLSKRDLDPRCIMSQSLSNYMMYLLVEYPSMLPKGIYEPRYCETKSDLYRSYVPTRSGFMGHWPPLELGVFHRRIVRSIKEDIVKPIDEFIVGQIRANTSAFRGGLMLAKLLLNKNFGSSEEKWEMISEVWVEMLIYAAGQGDWKEHAQALTRGGELITLVSLLKAHLGLTLQREAKVFLTSILDYEFDLWLETTLRYQAVGTDGLRNDGSPSFT